MNKIASNIIYNMSANDIVISGMSGRFPLSDNTDELAKNLYEGVDMVTGDDTRWPIDLYDMNPRMGKIIEFNRFDVTFFGLPDRLTRCPEMAWIVPE
ncbi:unnamed protein product [Medioppia subpectinata]|uniref:Beta-ketoacyl synthase-like N-terminal domain-containing protein n=1 Tax=Medioppia subpectinata TaxID=1979941 RepID=A0A7R9L169_9ACAR|nr:unnamed protein product [Medioppia subpectinata]CAG2113298.1 unnamed protein product [Medioppia subpectinata]